MVDGNQVAGFEIFLELVGDKDLQEVSAENGEQGSGKEEFNIQRFSPVICGYGDHNRHPEEPNEGIGEVEEEAFKDIS